MRVVGVRVKDGGRIPLVRAAEALAGFWASEARLILSLSNAPGSSAIISQQQQGIYNHLDSTNLLSGTGINDSPSVCWQQCTIQIFNPDTDIHFSKALLNKEKQLTIE